MDEQLALFWGVYDKYIATKDPVLRVRLSHLLSKVEEKSRTKQLLRPEKGWNKIFAWQVLRNQSITFSFDNNHMFLFEGEIIVWLPHWDRDVFITRVPKIEFVSGSFLKPGYHLDWEDQGDMSDFEWKQVILANGITDERGLYLPIYEYNTFLELCDGYAAEAKQVRDKYIEEEIAPR